MTALTPRARVLLALNHQETDRVPITLICGAPEAQICFPTVLAEGSIEHRTLGWEQWIPKTQLRSLQRTRPGPEHCRRLYEPRPHHQTVNNDPGETSADRCIVIEVNRVEVA